MKMTTRTPGVFLRAATSALAGSARVNRSRVEQCSSWETFFSPPTRRSTSVAVCL